ncbi:hypothetical protein ACTA71_011169 [Dictyostelium dimigraforme]
MSTTNIDFTSSSSSSPNNADSFDHRMKAMEEQINNLSLAFARLMKESSKSKFDDSANRNQEDSDSTEGDKSDEESDDIDIPSEYQLPEPVFNQFKNIINNQGLLDEEVCILKKNEISEMNKLFNFPSNLQVNVAPFGTPEGISIPNNLKNNDTDLLIVEKRINDSLKPLFLISSLLAAENTVVLVINSQATLGRVRRKNVAKEIYGSEVILPIKIKDTPKMFDETETERNNEARQSLLKQNYNSRGSSKKTSNSSGNNSTGNSSNSKSSSGSNGRSNNFNGSPSNVASGGNNTKSANRYSKLVFYSNVFTVPKPGTTLLRPVLDLKRLNSYIVNQSFKMEGIKNLPSMLKKGYYMVKLDIKKAYLHVLVDPQFTVIKEIRNFLKLDQCSPRKLAGLKGKLIALKDAIIPFRLYTRQTNKFYIQCLTLANGDWDQSFPVPQEVKSEISIWLTGKEISLFPNFDYVLTTDAPESGAGATLKKGNTIIKTWSLQWSSNRLSSNVPKAKQLQTQDPNGQHHNSLLHQSPRWSNSRFIDSLRKTLGTTSQEEDHSNWRTHSRFLQSESRSPLSSLRNESQNDQKDQELQLATEERSIQSHPTSIRSS